MEVPSQKSRLDGFAQLDERPVGGMLHVGAGKAPQDGLRLSGAHAQGGGVLDHIVILLADQRPVDGLGQDRLQVGVGIDLPGWGWTALCGNGLETRHEIEAQQMAKGEGHLALPMTIDVVLLDLHLGAMPQDPFNHGGDLGGRAALELRVDTDRLFLHMPVDHHPRPPYRMCHSVMRF